MWQIAGNVNLNLIQFEVIYDLVNQNLARCCHGALRNDMLLMLKGGYCVDSLLVDNPSSPFHLEGLFDPLIIQIEMIGQ